MVTRFLARAAVVACAALVPSSMWAQSADRPSHDVVTIGGRFGGLSGATDLNQTNTADWRLGFAASVDVTVWLNRFLGVRGNGTWGQDSIEGSTPSLTGRRKFNKFFYDGGVVLRYPWSVGQGSLIPYVTGGAGALSYHQLDGAETFTRFAGNLGAGLEYRYRRIGFRAEGRDFIYEFERFGFDNTQHDIIWDGGITLSF